MINHGRPHTHILGDPLRQAFTLSQYFCACSIIRRFGIAANPLFNSFFFFVFVSVMHFGVEPSRLHHLLQSAGDRQGATLLAGIFSTIDFESVSHKAASLTVKFDAFFAVRSLSLLLCRARKSFKPHSIGLLRLDAAPASFISFSVLDKRHGPS
jgi:hypothetical protein